MRADLHTHTNASDGFMSRDTLLKTAAARSVECIAITDHDTMVNSYSADTDLLNVIEGCELSGFDSERGTRAHILCYLPKDIRPLLNQFERMKSVRNRTAEQIIEKVHVIFPEITYEKVCDKVGCGGVVYKTHIMQLLMESGRTDEVYGQLYKSLFSSRYGSCYVKNTYPEAESLVKLIREARGIAVFAHPSVYESMELVGELAKRGFIDGIEYNHPKNNSRDKEKISSLCEEFKLLKTGGTDYHGQGNVGEAKLGDCLTDEDELERLMYISETK
ncbi:MAG: PHP domain-containing protein [Oscillospiraceae bacterium]